MVCCVTESGDKHKISVGRVNNDAVDLHRVFESDMLPALASITGFPHAIAKASADGVTGSGVNDIWVRGCDLNCADTVNTRLLIKDWGPRHTSTGRLPYAA